MHGVRYTAANNVVIFRWCSWQLSQRYACNTRLSSGQIWALLSRLSNPFWSSLLPQLLRSKARMNGSYWILGVFCTVWFSCAGKFRSQTPMHIDIFFSFSSFFLFWHLGLDVLGLGWPRFVISVALWLLWVIFFPPKSHGWIVLFGRLVDIFFRELVPLVVSNLTDY